MRWQAVIALVSEAHDVLMFYVQTARLNQTSSVSYSESFHRSRPFLLIRIWVLKKANKETTEQSLREAATRVGISDASY